MKRVIYLGYYIKKLDWKKFFLFLNYTAKLTGRSKVSLLIDVIRSVFLYNISILEYFQFRFFEKKDAERREWAGTGFMYEYQQRMNPVKGRAILDDKVKFYRNYKSYFVHQLADLNDLRANPEFQKALLHNPTGKLVFKVSNGKCGEQVEIRSASQFDENSLPVFMKNHGYDLVEEFIRQHPKLNELSPSAVNTVRIFTQLNEKDEVELLGCRLRISVNSPVDNMAAGNLAAPIDDQTGIVSGPAVYSDITKSDQTMHPITGVQILGFEVPFWKETVAMAKEAALKHPQNRSIGWDIVITDKGPGFIEGNHDWCKLLWQLPAKKGMKNILKSYYEAYV